MYDEVIKTYITVVEMGSFSKAASRLYMSRVSVMKQINGLEARLGFKLIERKSTGIVTTKAGESYYKDALDIVKRADEAEQKARRIAGAYKTEIRIGSSLLHPADYIVSLWEVIGSLYPQIKLRIVPFSDNTLLEDLGVKFDVVVGVDDSEKWKSMYGLLKISNKTIAAAMPKTHRLASRNMLKMDDLKHETIIMVPPGDSVMNTKLRHDIEELYKDVEIINAPDYYYDIEVFNMCVENECILLSFDYWANVHPMLKTIPVDWNYTIPYGIIYPKNVSGELWVFLDALKLIIQRGLN